MSTNKEEVLPSRSAFPEGGYLKFRALRRIGWPLWPRLVMRMLKPRPIILYHA